MARPNVLQTRLRETLEASGETTYSMARAMGCKPEQVVAWLGGDGIPAVDPRESTLRHWARVVAPNLPRPEEQSLAEFSNALGLELCQLRSRVLSRRRVEERRRRRREDDESTKVHRLPDRRPPITEDELEEVLG